MCTHLVKRGSRYYFRRRIPSSLVIQFKRTEILRSLKTSARREAEKLARLEGCYWDAEFARLQGESQPATPIHDIAVTKPKEFGPTLSELYQQWLAFEEKAPKTRNKYPGEKMMFSKKSIIRFLLLNIIWVLVVFLWLQSCFSSLDVLLGMPLVEILFFLSWISKELSK